MVFGSAGNIQAPSKDSELDYKYKRDQIQELGLWRIGAVSYSVHCMPKLITTIRSVVDLNDRVFGVV